MPGRVNTGLVSQILYVGAMPLDLYQGHKNYGFDNSALHIEVLSATDGRGLSGNL